jgi:hypothetical protein
MKLLLILLAICVCTASAVVCRPNFCATVVCPKLSQEICASQNAVYVPYTSLCGCCPSCLTEQGMIIIGVIVIANVININNTDPSYWQLNDLPNLLYQKLVLQFCHIPAVCSCKCVYISVGHNVSWYSEKCEVGYLVIRPQGSTGHAFTEPAISYYIRGHYSVT